MTAAITFHNISVTMQDTQIINTISGQFPKGQITTLVGPSGAGKTTILKLCNALLSPTDGTIFYNDQELKTYNPLTLRRCVGMALQDAPMIKGSVYDNLNLPRQLQGETLSKDEAIQALQQVGLDAKNIHKKAHDLSGGQRQKLSIARTLINPTDVLLLDEITSALDPHSVTEIEQLIVTMKQRGVTIIWITHNLEQARRIGDYMWLMHRGQLIESGSIHLLETSQNERVQQFMRGELL
ncbi:amino acid ABC transporter ATP-binding protein [Kurthia sp. 3B1D]|uniref:Amino acid ABC transporter ATP-binding protein n=2 Tax=Kurthia TaxID=1649 RepID=A0A433RWZ6_9BACL|nr:phosphate ABC transporter ATP-binding protein [Kurthia sp. 3B1D]RUS57801.1 amino acid ABC transporter ATP-binding protein [Kurthia sp. 3B1D]